MTDKPLSSADAPLTDREQLLQWFFAAQRQIAAGRRDRAHELLAECLAIEPDNLLVGKLFVENLVALGRSRTPSSRRRLPVWPVEYRTWRQITDRLLKRPRDRRALEALVRKWNRAAPPEILCETLPLLADWCQDSHACWVAAARALSSVGRCDAASQCWERAAHIGGLTDDDAELAALLKRLPPLPHHDAQHDETTELAVLAKRAAVARASADRSENALIHQLADRLQQHYWDVAIDIYRRRLERSPGEEADRRELVRALRATGDWGAIGEVLESSPCPIEDPELLAVRAEYYQRARDFSAALHWYEQAIRHLERDSRDQPTPQWVDQAVHLARSCQRHDLTARWEALRPNPPQQGHS